MKEKKDWQKPELVILLRGNPEEAVLTMCKGTGHSGADGGTGPITDCTVGGPGGACAVTSLS